MTITLIDKQTEDAFINNFHSVGVWTWLRGVCIQLNVDIKDVIGISRKQELCIARFTIAGIMTTCKCNKKTIAYFLKRDRSTINYYIKQYENYCKLYRK